MRLLPQLHTRSARDTHLKSGEPVTFLKISQRNSKPSLHRIGKMNNPILDGQHRDKVPPSDTNPHQRRQGDRRIKGLSKRKLSLQSSPPDNPGEIPRLCSTLIRVCQSGDLPFRAIHPMLFQNAAKARRATSGRSALQADVVVPAVLQKLEVEGCDERLYVRRGADSQHTKQGRHSKNCRQHCRQHARAGAGENNSILRGWERSKLIQCRSLRNDVEIVNEDPQRRNRKHPREAKKNQPLWKCLPLREPMHCEKNQHSQRQRDIAVRIDVDRVSQVHGSDFAEGRAQPASRKQSAR